MPGDAGQGHCPCTPPKGLRPFGIPRLRPFHGRRGEMGWNGFVK